MCYINLIIVAFFCFSTHAMDEQARLPRKNPARDLFGAKETSKERRKDLSKEAKAREEEFTNFLKKDIPQEPPKEDAPKIVCFIPDAVMEYLIEEQRKKEEKFKKEQEQVISMFTDENIKDFLSKAFIQPRNALNYIDTCKIIIDNSESFFKD